MAELEAHKPDISCFQLTVEFIMMNLHPYIHGCAWIHRCTVDLQVYIYIYIYICIYTFIHLYMFTWMSKYVCVCVCVCVYVCVCVCVCVCMRLYVLLWVLIWFIYFMLTVNDFIFMICILICLKQKEHMTIKVHMCTQNFLIRQASH